MSSKQGGAIYVSQAGQLSVKNTKFLNLLAIDSGALYIVERSNAMLVFCTFKQNKAAFQGVFKVMGQASIIAQNSQFTENEAFKQNSIGLMLQLTSDITFSQCIFAENKAVYPKMIGDESNYLAGKGIEIISYSAGVIFDKCQFEGNIAQSSTPNLYMNRAIVNITNSQFQGNNRALENIQTQGIASQYSEIKGDFIQAIAESKVYVANSQFHFGIAFVGGAIYTLGDSDMTFEDCHFEENGAELYGGAIAAESFGNIIFKGRKTNFKNNFAHSFVAETLFFQTSTKSVVFNETQFSHKRSTNFIQSNNAKVFKMLNTVMEVTGSSSEVNNIEGGISIYDSIDIFIYQSVFRNLRGNSELGGGAIYMTQSLTTKGVYETNGLIFENTFENCSNINGGALTIDNMEDVRVTSQNLFIGNRAEKMGGAIYFKCDDYGEDMQKCYLQCISSTFKNNYAGIEGGAIKWNFYEPQMINPIYINNTARLYGGDIASVAKYIVRLREDQLNLKSVINKKSTQQTSMGSWTRALSFLGGTDQGQIDEIECLFDQNTTVENVQSGGEFTLYFALIDKYGTIVRTDKTSSLFLSVQMNDTKSKGAGQNYSSVIETSNVIVSESGIFKVEKIVIVGKPNSEQTLSMWTDGINKLIPDNRDFSSSGFILVGGTPWDSQLLLQEKQIDQTATNNFNYQISIQLRGCTEGEELLSSGKCRGCEEGTYSLEPPTYPGACKQCPNTATCLGSSEIYPRPGYWRRSNATDKILSCRNEVACLGGILPEKKSMGSCAEGYTGVLCATCSSDYSRTGSAYKCSKCPSKTANSFRLLGLLVLVVISLTFIIRQNQNSASSQSKNFLPVFIRILLNHLQLLTLITTFDLDYPVAIQQFISSIKPVSEVATQFLSFDCFMKQSVLNDDATNNDFWRVYATNTIILALLPLAIIIVVNCLWQMIFLYKRYQHKSRKQEKILKQISFIPNQGSSNRRLALQPQNPSGVDDQNLRRQENGSPIINNREYNNASNANDWGVSRSGIMIAASEEIEPGTTRYRLGALRDNQSSVEDITNFAESQNNNNGSSLPSRMLSSYINFQSPLRIAHVMAQNDDEDEQEDRIGKVVSSFIIILFFIHPTITSRLFSTFNCEDIDGEMRLYEDLEVKCQSYHQKQISLGIALPAILIWCIGVPLYGLALIRMNKHNLQKQSFKSKFGFLYSGFNIKEAYLWEFVIVFRKLSIIFIQVFLQQAGKIVQAQATIAIVVINFAALLHYEPFTKAVMNNLEKYSLIASAVTVYCGIFYIAKASFRSENKFHISALSENFLFSMIVLSNLIFFLYWVHHFIFELRHTLRRRFPRFYVSLFLCCRENMLQREIEVEERLKRMQPLITKADEIISFLQNQTQALKKGDGRFYDDQFKGFLISVNSQVRELKEKKSGSLYQKSILKNAMVDKNGLRTMKSMNAPRCSDASHMDCFEEKKEGDNYSSLTRLNSVKSNKQKALKSSFQKQRSSNFAQQQKKGIIGQQSFTKQHFVTPVGSVRRLAEEIDISYSIVAEERKEEEEEDVKNGVDQGKMSTCSLSSSVNRFGDFVAQRKAERRRRTDKVVGHRGEVLLQGNVAVASGKYSTELDHALTLIMPKVVEPISEGQSSLSVKEGAQYYNQNNNDDTKEMMTTQSCKNNALRSIQMRKANQSEGNPVKSAFGQDEEEAYTSQKKGIDAEDEDSAFESALTPTDKLPMSQAAYLMQTDLQSPTFSPKYPAHSRQVVHVQQHQQDNQSECLSGKSGTLQNKGRGGPNLQRNIDESSSISQADLEDGNNNNGSSFKLVSRKARVTIGSYKHRDKLQKEKKKQIQEMKKGGIREKREFSKIIEEDERQSLNKNENRKYRMLNEGIKLDDSRSSSV